MVNIKCSVHGCTSSSRRNRDLRFHRFPLDERCQSWIEACQRPDLKDKDIKKLCNNHVCSLHFEGWMYMKRKLINAAVPILHLPPASIQTIHPMTQTEAIVELINDLHSRDVKKQIETTSVDVSSVASTTAQASQTIKKVTDYHTRKRTLPKQTLQLENSVEDRVFGSFADNLSFLVNCLQSADKRTRSIIFLIDHFDMFCQGEKTQTLLYNMFDVAHAGRAPICVVGISSVLDVMDLLEKRVKSRFSHRHIYLFLNEATDGCKSSLDVFKDLFLEILSLPSNVSKQNASNESSKKLRPLNTTPSKKKTNNNRLSYDNIVETKINDVNFSVPQEILVKRKCENVLSNLDPTFIDNWNAHIQGLIQDERIVNAIEKFCYYETNEVIFRNILYEIVGKLSENKHFIHAEDVVATIDKTLAPEHRVKMLQSLSVLELSLIIAMKHGMEIFDKQPLNFEMVLHRYKKFADANSSTQNVPKGAILKAFEHLQELEIIVPVRSRDSKHSYGNTTSAVQKEYKLFTLPIPNEDIEEAVKSYKSLPTEINHWFNNSVF